MTAGVFRGLLRAPVQPWSTDVSEPTTVKRWPVRLRPEEYVDFPAYGDHNAARCTRQFIDAGVIIARETAR